MRLGSIASSVYTISIFKHYVVPVPVWNSITTTPQPSGYSTSINSLYNDGSSSFSFQVSVSNGPTGGTFYWTLNQISGTINTSTFTSGATSGTISLNGAGTAFSSPLVLTPSTNPGNTTNNEFQVQIRSGSTSGPVLITSASCMITNLTTWNAAVAATSGKLDGTKITISVGGPGGGGPGSGGISGQSSSVSYIGVNAIGSGGGGGKNNGLYGGGAGGAGSASAVGTYTTGNTAYVSSSGSKNGGNGLGAPGTSSYSIGGGGGGAVGYGNVGSPVQSSTGESYTDINGLFTKVGGSGNGGNGVSGIGQGYYVTYLPSTSYGGGGGGGGTYYNSVGSLTYAYGANGANGVVYILLSNGTGIKYTSSTSYTIPNSNITSFTAWALGAGGGGSAGATAGLGGGGGGAGGGAWITVTAASPPAKPALASIV